MKLLLFSDLHAHVEAARAIVARAASFDVLVGAGDFANMHRDIHVCIDILRSVDRPVVLVPGNNETTDELRAACHGWRNAVVLHGNGTHIDGVDFFGIGGGIPPTPFGDWSFDWTEEEATQLLKACPSRAVLISHSPPQGCLDRNTRGEHLGSQAFRTTISRTQPRLGVCGHVHASNGQIEELGVTTVINAGPSGVAWTLG